MASTIAFHVLTVCLLVQSSPSAGASAPPDAKDARPREFAQGVSIDWVNRRVEIEAKVVLREGALELLACSPQTREHESIFQVAARPMHIFQALGLIGLDPGKPVRYDEAAEKWHPPTGPRLAISVRFKRDDAEVTLPAERLLRSTDAKAPLPPIEWVFAGSRTLPSGKFAADADGTVICFVDFESALITVGALHSADNELLWLEAAADQIPPLGTKCVIVVSAKDSPPKTPPEDKQAPPAAQSDKPKD